MSRPAGTGAFFTALTALLTAAAAVLPVLSACLMLSFCKAQPNTEEEPITE